MRRLSRLSDQARSGTCPQVAATHDEVDRQGCQAFGEAAGILLAELGERVRVVLVAGLEGVGGIRLTLAVTNDDELLKLGHVVTFCTRARMNSWVTSTSTVSVSVWLLSTLFSRCSAWSTACTSCAVSNDCSATLPG